MPGIASQPVAAVTPNLVSGEVGYRVTAVPFQFIGGIVRMRQTSNDARQINSAALANNATATLWTPAAGFFIRLDALVLSSSVAGPITLRFSGQAIGLFQMVANVPFAVPLPADGLCIGVANGTLQVFNGTGAASDIKGMMIGLELS